MNSSIFLAKTTTKLKSVHIIHIFRFQNVCMKNINMSFILDEDPKEVETYIIFTIKVVYHIWPKISWQSLLRWKPLFIQKNGCITTIVVYNKLKSWWHPLIIKNTNKRLKNLYNNILELKVHFESKLILIQQLDEEDGSIKSMYIKYNLYFFDSHRASCL